LWSWPGFPGACWPLGAAVVDVDGCSRYLSRNVHGTVRAKRCASWG
jgi:hypothetical protein